MKTPQEDIRPLGFEGADDASAALEMIDGTKRLQGKAVLHHMNLRLERRETVVILGRSGTGKSVLLKCLVGLLKLDEGSVRVRGQDLDSAHPAALNDIRKKLGFLFQSAAIYESLSVRENLLFHIRRQLLIRDHAESERLATEVLRDVGLEDALKKMPAELSGGMRKRLGLARALVSRPELMLYDEPTTGLDPVTSAEISRLIRETQNSRGVASLVVTHDMRCAEITSDRVVVIGNGACLAEGTFKELGASHDPSVHAFFS